MRRIFTRAKIILDLRETRSLASCFGERIEHQGSAGAIIKQCVKLFVKKRQPMFQTLMAASFADGFVKSIAARCRSAEMCDIGLAEIFAWISLVSLHFAHWHEIERAELAGRVQLRLRDRRHGSIPAHRPKKSRSATGWCGIPGGKKIEDAAAHGIFTRVAHA